MSASSMAARLARAHARLDELFGRFLGAAAAGDPDAARVAMAGFDEALRSHTRLEDEAIGPSVGAAGLAPSPDETDDARLSRELRLEHVQIRELSAMIRRSLEEKRDLEAARRLAPNLACRWDAHTAREEREAGRLERSIGPDAAGALFQEDDERPVSSL